MYWLYVEIANTECVGKKSVIQVSNSHIWKKKSSLKLVLYSHFTIYIAEAISHARN